MKKSQGDTVLDRLEPSVQVTLSSLKLPALPRGNTKSSWRSKIVPPLDVPCVYEDISRNQRSPESLYKVDEESFWRKVYIGGQMAALACEDHRDGSPTSSSRSVSCLSCVDSQTPRELRDISLFEDSFRPTPPPSPPPPPPRAVPLSRRRASHLPVLATKYSRAVKEVADGCWLATAPVVLKKTTAVAPKMAPAATSKRTPAAVPRAASAAVPKMTTATTPKWIRQAGPKVAPAAAPKREKVKLHPVANPVKKLSVCLEQLSSDVWTKKIDGMKTIQDLAQHHPETLKTKLTKVCLALIQEVNSLRSAVARAALTTMAELYINLKKAMDLEVDRTGQVLLLKFGQTTNTVLCAEANRALDAMVENCSHDHVLNTLLRTAMNHRCAAVRSNMTHHLHRLAVSVGADHVLTAERGFTEMFLVAVSKLCVDGAPEARQHSRLILQELAQHKDFLTVWRKIIPQND